MASLGSALLDLAGLGSCFALQALSLEDTPPQKKNGFKETVFSMAGARPPELVPKSEALPPGL